MQGPTIEDTPSPEEVEADGEHVPDDQAQTEAQHDPGLDNHISPSGQPARPPIPLPKRRRVTRACDECRRKKIKCDGRQPCTHCTVYSYGEWTY